MRSKYTKKQRTAYLKLLAEYCYYLKGPLGLRDWDMKIVWQIKDEKVPKGECAVAMQCTVVDHRRYAVIDIYESFMLEQDYDQLHHMMIHELIHCHTGPMRDMVRGSLPLALKSQRAHDVLFEVFRQHEEQVVDNMAASFADLIQPPREIIKKLRKV